MKLREYLKVNKMPYKKLAELIGVSEAQISRISNGLQNPSAHLIYKIIEVTKGEVMFEDLFTPNAPSRLNITRRKRNEKS